MIENRRFPLSVLTYLAGSFIAAFGITQPAPRQQRLVALALGGLLLLAAILAVCVLGFLCGSSI
ncbi:MAG TPA: hypothetical protein VGD59_03460 [Acidisarcina sp.]